MRANQQLEKQSSFEEPKGTLIQMQVLIKQQEMINYVFRMSSRMPVFSLFPRGKEIIHRLIMRAATVESIDDLAVHRTPEAYFDVHNVRVNWPAGYRWFDDRDKQNQN